MSDALDPETFCQQVPIAAEYASAFRAIGPELSEHHLRMLRAHYRASEHTLTATRLAYEMGYTSYGSANLLYGRLGRKVSEAFGIALAYWVNVLVLLKGEVTGGFHDFDVDVSGIHMQPVPYDILVHYLANQEREKLASGSGRQQ